MAHLHPLHVACHPAMGWLRLVVMTEGGSEEQQKQQGLLCSGCETVPDTHVCGLLLGEVSDRPSQVCVMRNRLSLTTGEGGGGGCCKTYCKRRGEALRIFCDQPNKQEPSH